MSEFFEGSWNQPVEVMFNPRNCPFNIYIVQEIIRNQCGWLHHATGIDISYGGFTDVPVQPETPGFVIGVMSHKQFVDVFPWSSGKGYWAYTRLYWDWTNSMYSVAIGFDLSKVDSIDKFAGILLHEIYHGLGIRHINDSYSIMNNDPYLDYKRQATSKYRDLVSLSTKFDVGTYAYPSVNDHGAPNGGKLSIHIPSIVFEERFWEVTLDATRAENFWYLDITRKEQVQDHLVPVAHVQSDGNVLVPVWYRSNTYNLTMRPVDDDTLKLVGVTSE